MKVEIEERYSKAKCLLNPDKLFIFGDNVLGVGKGGQAVIRDCDNAYGIPTKISPHEYMTDEDYIENINHISGSIVRIKQLCRENQYEAIVFPLNGLGTGLSNMQIECPRIFLFLCTMLLEEFGFNNMQNLKSE